MGLSKVSSTNNNNCSNNYSCHHLITFLVFTTTGGSFQLLDCSPPEDGADGWYNENTVGCGGMSLLGCASCVASGIGGGWNCDTGG